MFSQGFDSVEAVQSSNGQKAGSNKALCSMWKIQVSDEEKSMHSLYTSQHPHIFFSLSLSSSHSLCSLFFSMKLFHTEDTYLRRGCAPLTQRRLKFISLTPDKPPPPLSLAQEVEPWRNRSYGTLSRKKEGKKNRHWYTHTSYSMRTHAHKTHPWVHVDKFFNKLWLKGSWFYSESPPSFQTVYWK